MAMPWECFCFDFTLVQHEAQIMFSVATDTTISFSLGKQFKTMLSLSFIDVYGLPPQQQQIITTITTAATTSTTAKLLWLAVTLLQQHKVRLSSQTGCLFRKPLKTYFYNFL
jgi:hypothetical protein